MNPRNRSQALAQIGLSGPETLLLGLRRTVKFDLKEEGELDGIKVWKFRGTWRSRQGLVGVDGRPVAAGGFLPPYIPMDATLYLGKENGWPYKLVLVGRKPSVLFETRRIGPDGRRSVRRARSRRLFPVKSRWRTKTSSSTPSSDQGICLSGSRDGGRRRRNRGPRQDPRSINPDGDSEEERRGEEGRARARPADRHSLTTGSNGRASTLKAIGTPTARHRPVIGFTLPSRNRAV